MSDIKHLKESEFDDFIEKGHSVIDFYADWCNPCMIMAPHFEKVAGMLKGKVKFAKVDIEAEGDLAQRFDVMSIPTTIFFSDGEMVDRVTGAMSASDIEKRTKANFKI